MLICDICSGKVSGQKRDLPFNEFGKDMCEKHWKEYQEAVKLLTALFSSKSDVDWSGYSSRLLASRDDVKK